MELFRLVNKLIHKIMSSYLDFNGVYDKTKRYIVNNWTDEDFSQSFGSESIYNDNKLIEVSPAHSIIVKAGESREFGQFEAYTITKGLVDREIFKDADKQATPSEKEKVSMGANSRDFRKPYEDKTLQEITSGTMESPFIDRIKEQIRKEMEQEKSITPEVPVSSAPVEVEADKDIKPESETTGEFAE